MTRTFIVLLLLGFSVGINADEPLEKSVRLNQIQVLATHNSYHVRPPEKMLKSAIAVNRDAKTWDYTRQPLDKQLDAHVRSFELDLHLSASKGWMVMHVPTFDFGSTVETFRDALAVVRKWSDDHPRHVPISFLMELKEEGYKFNKAFRKPTPDDVLRLDSEIRASFPADRLLTPDDVRGDHPTLWDAVKSGAWPTLNQCAGKVFFILHDTGPNRQAYLDGHPSLEKRAMFVESDLEKPHSAVLVRNNPLDPTLEELAKRGYLIRTRVDSQGDKRDERRAKGLASGAHLLTTDYPPGEIEPASAFTLPSNVPARIHPITGPTSHRGQSLAEPIP